MQDGRQLAGVSAALSSPATTTARPAVLLGPGAGSDHREPLITALRLGLAARAYHACTFNFPYRERGSRRPDPAPVLERCVADVARALVGACRPAPSWLVAGGKSMGGRIASQAAAKGLLPCRGLVFLGYPLHPPGRPERLRTAHLAEVRVPMLFVSGSRDRLAREDLLADAVGALGTRASIHWISAGDHSLAVPKRTGRSREDVLAEVVDVVAAWLGRLSDTG